MSVLNVLKQLDKKSLMFLCMVGFNSDDVLLISKNNQGWKFSMKDGRTINV